MRISIAILFLARCFLLYYGGTMLLLVPGALGEPYLNWDRIRYGGVPFVIALVALAVARHMWGRSGGGIRQRRLGSAGAVVLGTLVVVIGYSFFVLLAGLR